MNPSHDFPTEVVQDVTSEGEVETHISKYVTNAKANDLKKICKNKIKIVFLNMEEQ